MAYNKPNSLSTLFIKDDLDYFGTLEDELFDCESPLQMRKSSVSFADNVLIQEITCISDMEIGEIDDTWYAQHDFEAIKAECRQLTKSVKSGTIEESPDVCLRGLEEKLNRNQKKVNRSEAISAVLDEQESQWLDDEKNTEALAQVYREFASHSLQEAVDQARQDQEAAFDIHGLTTSSPNSPLTTQLEGCAPPSSQGSTSLASRTLLVA